jgi:ribosomal protein S18 acetylase RimI-like enzyme
VSTKIRDFKALPHSYIRYSVVLNPPDSIDIRLGNADDGPAMSKFAISLSEDGEISKNKWLQIIKNDQVYPLVAVIDNSIVGKIQARIVENIGYLESARVTHSYRKKGLARSLIDSAMDWLISQNVSSIRTMVDSDNLPARIILERYNFIGHFLAINPSTRIYESDGSPKFTSDFTTVLEASFYEAFRPMVQDGFVGNVLVDGRFIPFTQDLFDHLVSEKRVKTNNDGNTIIILSRHNLPSEFYACVVSNSLEGYKEAGLAVRAYASQEMASFAICFAPTNRDAVKGLAQSNFGWSQPHSVIVYQRDPWQK